MPRPVICDMGHDEAVLAVYMVTELESGDVVALCGHCMLDLAAGMLRGAGAVLVMPGDRDAIDDPESLTGPVVAPPVDIAKEPAQRARTRRKLAARPDSPATSERDVGWPETSAATD